VDEVHRAEINWLTQRIASYQNLGNLAADSGRLKEAEPLLRKGLELAEELDQRSPGRDFHRTLVAVGHANFGLLYLDLRQFKQAEDHLGKALTIMKELAEKYPSSGKYQSDLAQTHNNLGRVHAAAARPQQAGKPYDAHQLEQAEKAYDEARKIQERLRQIHPTITPYQSDLAATWTNLGNVYKMQGRLEKAEPALQQAVALFTEIDRAHPGIALHQHGLAASHNNLGLFYLHTLRSPDQALGPLEEGRKLRKELVEKDPNNVQHQAALAASYDNLGHLHYVKKQFAEAADAYGQAVKHQRIVFQLARQALGARKTLSWYYEDHAKALRELVRPEEAAAVSRERLNLWPKEPIQLYNGACELATCVALVEKERPPRPAAEQDELRDRLADQAMDALRQAVAQGFTRIEYIRRGEKGKNLDPLRARADFQKLLAELEEKEKKNEPEALARERPRAGASG
jgi:tetratricopeptide (TPR) repeat protein